VIAPARSRSQRKADALARLRSDVDLWVASADGSGNAYLVPLSDYWDGATVTIATPRTNRTAVNLIGTTDRELEDAHAEAAGFDPTEQAAEYINLRITPRSIQAWREVNEMAERQLMRDGEWLA
jgi:hypothetical protein